MRRRQSPDGASALAWFVTVGLGATLLAAPPDWAPPPAHVTLDHAAVVAVSGAASTGDEYLLTQTPYRDYVLTFDARRLPFAGARPRAFLVVRADPGNTANRACISLEGLVPATAAPEPFRLVVLGDRVRLYRGGRLCAAAAPPTGTPPEQGSVGFLHYYDYGFRYENLDIVPLDATHLPPPGELAAVVRPSGVVALRWNAPAAIADLLSFDVFRAEGAGCDAVAANRIGTADRLEFTDRSARRGVLYAYRVAARLARGTVGPAAAPVTITVATAEPPRPPVQVSALRRIDGSVRISWQLPEDGRAACVRLLAGDTPITRASLAQATVIADGLPLDRVSFLAPPGAPSHLAVLLPDPDGAPGGLTAVEAAPSAPEVSAGRSWPTRHPLLLYDWAQVEAARRRIAEDETARKLFAQVCQTATAAIKTPPAAPSAPTDTHPLIGQLVPVGQAYVLSGDDQYAKWVRDVMLSYAAVYPSWPVSGGGRARMVKTASGLYEAVKYVPMICAYDLTFDSPVYSADDHVTIERDLLRPAVDLFRVKDYGDPLDARAADLHYRCYNFQAWFDAAIGLTGLLLRDADLVEHAIDGPYGFKHLLAHDIHDDGVFWERSIGYQNFVLAALYPLLEGCYHCNLDLWHLSVPDDYNTDREPLTNYCVGDGDNGPKSIKLLFDSQFYLGYGDLTRAQIADSDRGPLAASDVFRTAWVRYGDPRLAWLINRTRQKARPPAELHRSDADLSADIALAFDDGALYLAARVTDDVVNNSHKEASEVWAGDGLWFGLRWRGGTGGPYDFIYGLSPGDFRNTPPVAALFNRFGAPHNGISACRFAARRTASGYVLEAAFPLAEFAPETGSTTPPFRPKAGERAVVDFVVYDCDVASGASTKEKMVCWACTTDRYESAQGGTVAWGEGQPQGKTLVAPVATAAPAIDGDLADWEALKAGWAQVRKGASVLTDSPSGGPGVQALFYPQPKADEGAFDLRAKTFCGNGILQAGCALFPSTGFAILRERLDEQGRPPVEAVGATLNFGPYGGGHNHPDKLSLVLYARGKHWIPDFGSCAYESPEKAEWTAQTLAHNTMVVDGVSQYPTGPRNVMWPTDSADRQVRAALDFFHGDEVMKAAAAHCDSAYTDVRLARTLCLVGDVLFDFYAADAAAEHRYDNVFHIDGPLADIGVALAPKDGVLGEKCGYQHVSGVRQGVGEADFVSTWGGASGTLQVAVHGVKGTTVIVGEGPANSLTTRVPLLILRRSARQTLFAVAARPGADSPAAIRWLETGHDRVVAASTLVDGAPALVVFNGSGEPVTVDGLRVDGRLAVRRMRAGQAPAVSQAGAPGDGGKATD